MTQSILIIDDEADIRDILSDIFTDEGYHVHKAAHSEQALSLIKNNRIDLIVLDIWLDNSDMDGVQILKNLKSSEYKNIPILMISGHGNVEMAVNAMKMGAFDFIEKPFKIDHILLTANRALEQKLLKEENTRLKQSDGNTGVITNRYKSPAMVSLMKSIQDDAESDARILISGEKGTGKTYIAKQIHEISKRSKNRLCVFNCYDFHQEKIDEFMTEYPHSTIILENIETLSPDNQSILLSIIGRRDISCRFIATCDISIHQLIKNHQYSSTLYDRLSVIKYNVPPIRDRIEDLEILTQDFMAMISREFHIKTPSLSPKLLLSLKNYDWQGNIRQLKIAVEWIMMTYIINPESELSFESMIDTNVVTYGQQTDVNETYDMPLKQAREQFEKQYLEFMLNRFNGNIAQVAEYIDMERTALYRKLKLMDITYQDNKVAQS